MKVLLINGSMHEHGCTYTALKETAETLQAEGIETEIFWIGMQPVYGCIACNRCMDIGRCVYVADSCNEMLAKMIEADGIVVGSPVYYAGPNGTLCALLDRAFYSSLGKMAGKPAAAVVSCRRGGASAALDRLNKYFSMQRMITVGSQYWNMVHGFTPDEVRQDKEGLQTMRTLGREMAYWLKSREQGGVPRPVLERQTRTNFIR